VTIKPGDHVKLRVRHRTRFDYDSEVSQAHNELRVSPVNTGLQRVLAASIAVTPAVELRYHDDHFGNRVCHFNILDSHSFLEIVAEGTVETTHAICCGPESELYSRPHSERLAEFLAWSPGVPALDEYNTVPHAREINMDMNEEEFEQALVSVAHYFYTQFRYDPDVTHVYSSPREMFEQGGGVCQDKAHALIGVLRTAGIPARYVSGYIYEPARGEAGEQLLGASATHAWVQAWHQKFGWAGIDPTNDKLVDWQYVRTAIGRDYFDVQPVRGVFHGDVEQRLQVDVHVALA